MFRMRIRKIRMFLPPGSASGSVSQRYGYEDPDPYQNFPDLHHCRKGNIMDETHAFLQSSYLGDFDSSRLLRLLAWIADT
jgi:hypothetical protein